MTPLSQLAASLGLELRNDSGTGVIRVSSIPSADPGSLVFATDAVAVAAALNSSAGGVILAAALADRAPAGKALLLSANARLDFARAAQLLRRRQPRTGIHPTAMIDASASVAASASVGACAVLAAGVALGERTIVGEGAVLGEGVTLGEDCRIYPRAVLYPGTALGDRVIVHAGAVLGSDGFGYVRDPATGQYLQFPQQGRLLIEDDVEIGANATIDRGALDATVIGRGAKIDNLVHLGHNVQVGRDTIIAAQTGVSGSTTIGANVMLGGQAGIGDHAQVGDGVVLGGQGGILPGKKLHGNGVVFWGTPAQPLQHVLKEIGLLRRLRRKSNDKDPF